MKKVLIIVCVMFVASLTKADLIADWNFDLEKFSNGQPSAFGTAADYGIADSGNNAAGSDASGFHANSSTTWNFISGKPSTGTALSANNWKANSDYFQFSISTVGFTKINVVFDQESSKSGPGSFTFEYSTDGTHFTVFNAYSIVVTTGGSATFTGNNFTEDLTAITGLNNDPSVVFRLIDNSTTSANGGIVGSTGSSTVDNFTVNGIAAVPEPAAWGAISGLGLLGICGLRTWRQRRSGNHIAKAKFFFRPLQNEPFDVAASRQSAANI